MATRRQATSPPSEPKLTVPAEEARAWIDERLAIGGELRRDTTGGRDRFDQVSGKARTWHDFNREWLKIHVGERVATEYSNTGVKVVGWGVPALDEEWADLIEDVSGWMGHLESIRERLPLWANDDTDTQTAPDVDPNGPIFVVHGHDDAALHLAVRVLDATTDRKVTVLREAANEGRTLIEKFEQHAAAAAFAVVLITADDVGGPKSVDPGSYQPRGRQNVVFELGFFFGKLGRKRVMVLLAEGVEKPSDIDGLVYCPIDPAGAWKMTLAKELEASGIAVDYRRMP